MPFCRKCGRRLPQYSESCSDCGTSTTAPLIKIKKAPGVKIAKVVSPTPPAKVVVAPKTVISVKVVASPKPAKTHAPPKAAPKAKLVAAPEPLAPLTVEPHEIKKSNTSIEEDIITNPHDYETQTFDFDLKCPNGHFWREGKALPVSKGIAYCAKCGERLNKPKPRKNRKFQVKRTRLI